MTANKDQTETLVEQALARRAEQAPPDGFLLTRVHARLRRRRTGRRVGAALAATTAVATGIAGVNVLTGGDTASPPGPEQAARTSNGERAAALPDGWRWESFRNIEIAVPGAWGYGTTGYPGCLVKKRERPHVGRPWGAIPLVGCMNGYTVELPYRSSYVWLGDDLTPAGVRQRGSGWVEETRTVAGVGVTVFTDDAGLRQRILGSIRLIVGADVNGCATVLPDWARPGGRVAAVDGGLESVGTVTSVTVCKYSDGKLFAGATSKSGSVVEAILAAPRGTGPNRPNGCLYKFGTQVLVLKVHGSKHDQDVVVRYDGCDHHGVYDGTTVRKLTRNVLAPIMTGHHHPGGYGSELQGIVPPR